MMTTQGESLFLRVSVASDTFEAVRQLTGDEFQRLDIYVARIFAEAGVSGRIAAILLVVGKQRYVASQQAKLMGIFEPNFQGFTD